MYKLFKRVFFTLLTLSLVVASNKIYASHYAALDLYVTYIGAGADGCSNTSELKYEVTFEVYTNCPSNNPDNAGTLRIWSDEAGYTESYPLTPGTTTTGIDIGLERDSVDELCPNIQSRCFQPSSQHPGYFKNTYTLIWIAPSAQADWKFSAEIFCCRNAAPNIQGVSGVAQYIECNLNNVIKYNNSTPRFTATPFPFICVNQPAIYLNGPTDPNGDSLITSVAYPLASAVDTLYYDSTAGPYYYKLSDPIGSDPSNPFKMNPRTGAATFTPLTQDKRTLAFRCDEYEPKTGIRMGYVLRDVQFSILPCNTPPPAIDPVPKAVTGGKYTTKGTGDTAKSYLLVCPGANLTFDAGASSPDPNAQIYLQQTAEPPIAAATFAVPNQGVSNPAGTFSWTPTTNDLGEYTVTITAKDSTCAGTGFAIVLKNYQVVVIKVVAGLDAGFDVPICAIDPQPRQLFVRGTAELNSFKWTSIDGGPAENLSADNIPNPIATPKVTTSYIVKTDDLIAPCPNLDTVTVYVDTTNSVDVFPKTPIVMCRPEYMQLDAIVTGKGPVSNLSCGINNKNVNPECAVPDSIAIYGNPIFGRIAYDSVGSGPILNNQTKTSKHQFLVHRNDMKEYGMKSATIKSISFETANNGAPLHEYSNFRIAMKCTDKESLKSGEGFESNLVAVYQATTPRNFIDGIQNFDLDFPYNWDTSKNLLIEICYSNNATAFGGSCANPLTPQSPVIKYAPTTGVATLSYFPIVYDALATPAGYVPDTFNLDVCGALTSPNSNISQQQLRPVFGFKYCDAPSNPFTIKWTPGTLLSDSTILQPLVYVNQTAKYVFETFGKSGCLLRDSIEVFVPKHDFSIWPKDTAICLGETAQMEIRNAHHAIWHEYVNGEFMPADNSLSCTRCLNPRANPVKTTTYKVEIADSVWCFDTLEVTVNVLPPPDVRILTRDTIVKYGQPLQLLVSGARMYNWTPSSSLNNANISNPVALPTEPTIYVVAGIGSNGCRTYDTVRVGVDYRDNLMIPSAFTPNGDGKNDVFNIANLTFQRVMEFRVFNRWGQEVFRGNNNSGWDGKWKGTPQDMGNYQYLIRLGYPDGLVETYKGEVTIIK